MLPSNLQEPPPVNAPIVVSEPAAEKIPVLDAVPVKGVPPSIYNFIPFALEVPSYVPSI